MVDHPVDEGFQQLFVRPVDAFCPAEQLRGVERVFRHPHLLDARPPSARISNTYPAPSTRCAYSVYRSHGITTNRVDESSRITSNMASSNSLPPSTK